VARVQLKTVTTSALRDLQLAAPDKPLSLLAIRYAEAIDAADPIDRAVVLKELGPKLQAVLESLGMSPTARAKAGKVGTDEARPAAGVPGPAPRPTGLTGRSGGLSRGCSPRRCGS
jgi:hypothetical protein